MGRHGLPWLKDKPQWQRDGYPAVWEPEPPSRRGRTIALLSVAFVATVAVFIGGAKLLTSTPAADTSLTLAPACPPGITCATFVPPEAPAAEPAVVAEGDPGGGPSAEPPTAVPSPRTSGTKPPTPSPPTPSPTVTPRAETNSPRKTDDAKTGDVKKTPAPAAKTTAPTQKKTSKPTSAAKAAAAAPKRAVVKFTVTRESSGQYTAEIALGNNGNGDLNGWEIRLPVSGQVVAVDGAVASQQGRTLVLRSSELLPSGGGVAVTIAVRGTAEAPGACALSGGSCEVL